MEAFTHKYNTFKHIGDKVKFLHTICSFIDVYEGNTQNQALETGSNHSVFASSAVNIEHWINKLKQVL